VAPAVIEDGVTAYRECFPPQSGSPRVDRALSADRQNALFVYIDTWYNRERIQARLGWRSPDEYEAVWHAEHVVLDDHPAADVAGPDSAPAR
jgi:hypothetical protein